MSDVLQMLTNTQTIVQNGLEGLQGNNITESGFAAILEMLTGRLSSVELPKNLQYLSKEMQEEGSIPDVGGSGKLSLKEQESQESGIELLSMLLGNGTVSVKEDLNEIPEKDQEYIKELSQEMIFFAVQNPPIQAQQIDKPIETNLDCNKEQAISTQETITQMPEILEVNNISVNISENSSNEKDYKKRINENIEGIAGIEDVIAKKDAINLVDDKATEQFVLTQDKLTMLFAKPEDDLKDQQSPLFAKHKNDVISLPVDIVTSGKSEDKQKVIAQADNQNLVFEQFINQTDTRPIVSEKSIEIQANRLPDDLPEIIKVEIEQSFGKDGSKDLVVQLEPKELGKMLVKLASRDGIVSVKILVENADSKIILDNGVQNLKQVFSEQGIKYGRIEVEIGGQFTGQNNQQQPNWFREQQPQKRYDFNESQYYGDYEPIHATGTTLSNGKVDYLV